MIASNGPAARPMRHAVALGVSLYDRVAGWLISLNITLGVVVLLAFLFWLGHVLQSTPPRRLVGPVAPPEGRGPHAAGFERDPEAPGSEELEQETELAVQKLLEAVTQVVSSQAALLDALETTMVSSRRGDGVGDDRRPGPLGEKEVIPRWKRWEVRYNSSSFAAYVEQLDYFGIELAAIGAGRQLVDYVAEFGAGNPQRRSASGDEETRLYLTWSGGTLRRFDQRLLSMAGIRTQGRIVVQFYPKEVEQQLATIERAYAQTQGRDVTQVRQTVFGVRRKGAELEYYVIDQTYRARPSDQADGVWEKRTTDLGDKFVQFITRHDDGV